MAMSFVDPGADPVTDLDAWQDSLKSGSAAVLAKDAGKAVDQNVLDSFTLQVEALHGLGCQRRGGLGATRKD